MLALAVAGGSGMVGKGMAEMYDSQESARNSPDLVAGLVAGRLHQQQDAAIVRKIHYIFV